MVKYDEFWGPRKSSMGKKEIKRHVLQRKSNYYENSEDNSNETKKDALKHIVLLKDKL